MSLPALDVNVDNSKDNKEASDGGTKPRHTDSTPALPPTKQNGSLVTSQGLMSSQIDVSNNNKKNAKDSRKESATIRNRKNSDRIHKHSKNSKIVQENQMLSFWDNVLQAEPTRLSLSAPSIYQGDRYYSDFSEPSDPQENVTTKTKKRNRNKNRSNNESRSVKTTKSAKSQRPESDNRATYTSTKSLKDEIELPDLISKHENEEKKEDQNKSRPASVKSKKSRVQTAKSQISQKTVKEEAEEEEEESKAESKEEQKNMEESKSKEDQKSKEESKSKEDQKSKEATKKNTPSAKTQNSEKPTIKKDEKKFVATYTRGGANDKHKDANQISSPMSQATDETTTTNQDFKWHAEPVKYETNKYKQKAPPVKKSKAGSESGSSRTASTNINVHTGKKISFKLKGVKNNTKPMYSRDKKMNEMTPRTREQQRSKSQTISRPISFHLDRDQSIYRSHTHLWENQDEHLTHYPSTNTEVDVMVTYTGERNSRDALKSAKGQRKKEIKEAFTVFKTRSKIPPWYEGEYVLSKRQARSYIDMKSIYDKSDMKKKREKQFLNQLQQFQIEMARDQIIEMQKKEKRKFEDKDKQAKQLQELRQRFEDEAWHRFHTQYVTSRILEHEKMNRFQYGLPEEPDGDPEFTAKIKRKKKIPLAVMSMDRLKKVNKKKYGQLFKKPTGPAWDPNDKEPKMEGIDTVMLEMEDENGINEPGNGEGGNVKEKRRFVKNVIKEAKHELSQGPGKGNNTGITPRSPTVAESTGDLKVNSIQGKTPSFYFDDDDDDDDDDMSDIFERAKKKYNLDVDDDDDTSRIR